MIIYTLSNSLKITLLYQGLIPQTTKVFQNLKKYLALQRIFVIELWSGKAS